MAVVPTIMMVGVAILSVVATAIRPSVPLRRVFRRTQPKRPHDVRRGYRLAEDNDVVDQALIGPTRLPAAVKAIASSPVPPLPRVDVMERMQDIHSDSSSSNNNNNNIADATTTTTSSKKKGPVIKNVHDLQHAILDQGHELRDVQLDSDIPLLVNATNQQLLNHDVVQLMVQRFHSGSTPGNRAPGDNAKLALSIEGGGMRGAVSAGMAAAIACLGLCDAFDVIYGSSAGSVIGAYLVSRQMCMDVYVDILPAAKRSFVCTKRIMSSLAMTAADLFLSGVIPSRSSKNNMLEAAEEGVDGSTVSVLPKRHFGEMVRPGMNISFVLDGIMDEEHGIRPLDMKSFARNDKVQPLRVASSYARNGKLYSKCFGTEHFHGESATRRVDGKRKGLFACLEPSMTVPGATGPPVRLISQDHGSNEPVPYFDAFCFEPLPYRSAVQEGATHVLVLCSRPEGFEPKTKPGFYEQVVAPVYFRSHGEPEVAEFFRRGGQQYIYLEDMLTLEEGKKAGIGGEEHGQGIPVPPAKVLYGVERDQATEHFAKARDETWNKAHLLPLKVPLGTPELATLEQGRDEVRKAVQEGFAAAFDLLAPAIGLELDDSLTGLDVAKLIFPENMDTYKDDMLEEQMRVIGDAIVHAEQGRKQHVNSVEEKEAEDSLFRFRHRRHRNIFLRNMQRVLRILARNKRKKLDSNERDTATFQSTTVENSSSDHEDVPRIRRGQRVLRMINWRRRLASMDNPVVQARADLLGGANAYTETTTTDQTVDQHEISPTSPMDSRDDKVDAQMLLDLLPGFKYGRLSHFASGLKGKADTPAP